MDKKDSESNIKTLFFERQISQPQHQLVPICFLGLLSHGTGTAVGEIENAFLR